MWMMINFPFVFHSFVVFHFIYYYYFSFDRQLPASVAYQKLKGKTKEIEMKQERENESTINKIFKFHSSVMCVCVSDRGIALHFYYFGFRFHL